VRPAQALLTELAARTAPDTLPDTYGSGELLETLERRVATLLGKEAAVFMPSGTMAQQIALRIWSERTGRKAVAYHAASHLALHEANALSFLHGLRPLVAGTPNELLTPHDVRALADPIAALLIELPQRELGARLPEWDDLVALCAAARERGMALHLDGARLWEAQPYYERPHAEIAALFDSVYVSFYKGLGALAGAALAGDAELIAEARVWQHRHGGRLVTLAPFALSALQALDARLASMSRYRERALAIADALRGAEGIDIVPDPPQTNTFHLYLRGERERIEERAYALARERSIWALRKLAPTPVPALWKWEFVVGDATFDFTPDEAAELVCEVAQPARERV
jgi:threonine aldolase